ncbi:RNA-directed DNA polymerase from mobile element jockey [Eumeta japonica]|uniref:RNA-directed DNA polymerase from mobile element jockey n=1 Tax=Eumeta variegata TaxID=151549 RepID=A0A4C1SRY8_EUMVA|nr:RNA-directed DNA polymerase from mobile element jockey [Eumeta japonica]
MGCKIEEYSDLIFCYIGETKELHGVGFIIKKIYKNNITNFIGISERVALLQLKFECFSLSIIQAYAPTERSTDEEIENFYKGIEYAHTKTEGKAIVMGDFNAKIGCPKTNDYPVMGKYGYGVCNERGQRLLSYGYQYKLSIMNSFFKKKESRRWTRMSPNQKTYNEIDFIMTNHHKLITNVEALSKFKFSFDDRLVRETLLLRRPVKSRKTYRTPLNIPKTETEIKNYIENLQTHTENIETGCTDIQAYYNILEKGITDSLKFKNNTHPHEHNIFSKDTIQLIKRRMELIHTKNKTKDMKKELSRIYKETNRSIRKDYKNHRYEIISRNITNFRSAKKAHRVLTTHKSWIQKLEKNSAETKCRKDVINHATNFYKNLYRKQNNPANKVKITHMNKTDSIKQIEDSEVYEQIKKLKDEKSPGPDGLCNEILKIGAPILTRHFTQLFNMILQEEKVPKQWCTSDIILLFKKESPLDIGNYRPISLLAIIYKLFSSIILKRISNDIDKKQPKEQAGFRLSFSTMDRIQTLEQIIEKYREYNRSLYVAFIDYSKAFDSISHCSIWNALQSNINYK